MDITCRVERPLAITAASHSDERPARSTVTISSALSSSSEATMRRINSLGGAAFAGAALTGADGFFFAGFAFAGLGAGLAAGFFAFAGLAFAAFFLMVFLAAFF